MRIAILSDIHSNPWALNAVLAHARRCGAEEFWCLGDLIGYGPRPVECIKILHDTPFSEWVTGNHETLQIRLENYNRRNLLLNPDMITSGMINIIHNQFRNEVARKAIEAMLRNMLTMQVDPVANWYHQASWDVQNRRIKEITIHNNVFRLCHTNPPDANNFPWNSPNVIKSNLFSDFPLDVGSFACVLFGHTHIPTYFTFNNECIEYEKIHYGRPYPISQHTAINPGSVGHPRDLDSRAAYAVIDTGVSTVTYYRVDYLDRSRSNPGNTVRQEINKEMEGNIHCTAEVFLSTALPQEERYIDNDEERNRFLDYKQHLEKVKFYPGGGCDG